MLNTSVTVQARTITQDALGGQQGPTWTNVKTVPASVQPMSDRERQAFRQRMIYVDHKIYTAMQTGVKRGDRVVAADGRKFVVRGFGDMAGRGRAFYIAVRLQTDG